MKAVIVQRVFDRKRYSELRRRVIRHVLRPWSRAGAAATTLVRGLDAAEVRRVLICRPNHRLGNLLLLTPLVGELQVLLPRATVDIVLAGDGGADLFRGFSNIGCIYSLSRRMVRHPFATGRIALQIRRAHYDLAIDPCEASQSGRLLVALARPRHVLALPRDGASAPAWLRGAPTHMGQWPVYLLRGALQPASAQHRSGFPALDLRLSADERACGREALARLLPVGATPPARTLIGVFVEATGAKRLGLDWWQRFLREMRAHQPGSTIIEIVPADGRPRLAPEFPRFGSPSPRKVAAVIASLSAFVSADCGVLHLASAAGVPTYGLFSASDNERYAPYGHGSQALRVNEKSPEEIARAVSAFMHASNPGTAESASGFADGCPGSQHEKAARISQERTRTEGQP